MIEDTPRSRRENTPVVLEDVADNRLWRARLSIPGIYVVDAEKNDSVFFEVRVHLRRHDGRRITKVIPVSRWVDGNCVGRAKEVEKGEWPQFLPSCVLFGKLDFDRLPDAHYNYLEGWANLILDAVDRWDELNPRRERQQSNRRRDN